MKHFMIDYENGSALIVRAKGKRIAKAIGEEEYPDSPVIRVVPYVVERQHVLKGFENGKRMSRVSTSHAESKC